METRSIKIWMFAALTVLAMAVSGFGNFARAADASPTPITKSLSSAATTVVNSTKAAATDVKSTFQKIRDFPLTTIKDSNGQESPITLGNSVCALLFLVFGYLFSRFLGVRLEQLSVRRFHVPSGSAQIVRNVFVILLFALIAIQVLSAYHISLTVFAFLGGALALGVGFGAQNIMSNFISGIILIFERPMRNGDSIEINNVSGKVKKIGLRASLIQRSDGVDVLIPNRSFLENTLLNKTYSNHFMRYSLAVGVPYGSEIEPIKKLLMKIIIEHDSVLKKPAPQVLLSAFGQYAMVFTLNYWIELGIDTDAVASDLRAAAEKMLGEHEIELKCPL